MPDFSGKIEILEVPPGQSPWDAACARLVQSCQGRTWDLPFWIVADERHRQAASLALMRHLQVQALPTYNIFTLISLAGKILNIPVLDAFVSPQWAALTLREIAPRDRPEAYVDSWDAPGFAETFWSSVEEAESRGHFPNETLPGAPGSPPPPHFKKLHCRLQEMFQQRRRYTAGELLRRARRTLLEGKNGVNIPSPLFIGPLFKPNPLEWEFIRALSSQVDTRILMPAESGKWPEDFPCNPATTAPASIPQANISLLRPRTPGAELDAAFGLIARWVAEGKYRYQDVRIYSPFVKEVFPRIRSTAERYCVPLKGHIARSLAEFPGVILLLKLLDLFDRSWDRNEVLEILRSRLVAASPAEISSVIKAVLSEGKKHTDPPGEPWIALAKAQKAQRLADQLEYLQKLDRSGRGAQTGQAFARWVHSCIEFVRKNQEAPSGFDFETQQREAEERRGWESLESVLNDFGGHFTSPLSRSRLLRELKGIIRLVRYMPVDYRLDAVEICAGTKQDHLPVPVVFYLSLNSRVPSPGRPSPFLETESPADYNEQFGLFQLLIGNAGEEVILSCPQFDDDGGELALSPFLSSLQRWIGHHLSLREAESWQSHRALLQDVSFHREVTERGKKIQILRERPLAYLCHKSLCWSATRLEHAIQCPYLHFAQDVLGLEPLADRIAEGIVPLTLGAIAHKALEQYLKAKKEEHPFDIEAWVRKEFRSWTWLFDPHPETDRAEAELVQCLADFVQRGGDQLSSQFSLRDVELSFGMDGHYPPLILDLSIGKAQLEGRIDRLDEDPDGNIIVIDYKYQKLDSSSKGEFFSDLMEGTSPQLPLYGLFVQDVLGKKPVALLQIYLRSSAALGLMLSDIEGLAANLKESKIEGVSLEMSARIYAKAIGRLEETADQIARGLIHPKPRDYRRCGPGRCSYADLCRYRQRWQ